MSRPTLFTGGPIWTGGLQPRHVEAVLVEHGQVIAVGPREALRGASGPSEPPVEFDLEGRALLPGFVDAHTHFLTGGRKLACVDLRSARTPAEMVERVARFAARHPPGEWIVGGDWDHENWGGELPSREWIDAATPQHPVWIHRLDIHMTLSNSLVLERAGIDRDTPDPPGGTIVRDADGEPTGVLKDTAMELVGRHLPEPTDADRDRWLQAAARHALAAGLTQIHDVDGWASLHAYRRAHASGHLPLRVYAAVPMRTHRELSAFVQEHGFGDDWLRWGGLKAFVDGSLGSRTAWFHEPYPGEPDNRGLVVTDLDELADDLRQSDHAGLQSIVHAIGDRAVDWILDRYAEIRETHPPRDRRPRVEHAQHISPGAAARFGPLGVIPSVQPAHAVDDGRWAEARLGAERMPGTYAFRSMAEGGARLAFGSDWTVAPLDPIGAVAAAVTRRLPEHERAGTSALASARDGVFVPAERMKLEEALVAHTVGAAYAGFFDGHTGSIEPGKAADFVVLDRDPFHVDETELSGRTVEYTFVAGRIAYARESEE